MKFPLIYIIRFVLILFIILSSVITLWVVSTSHPEITELFGNILHEEVNASNVSVHKSDNESETTHAIMNGISMLHPNFIQGHKMDPSIHQDPLDLPSVPSANPINPSVENEVLNDPITMGPNLPMNEIQQVVILRADDFLKCTGVREHQWERFVDLIHRKHIKACIAVIGKTLIPDNQECIGWMLDLVQEGSIEFIHHGFDHKKNHRTGKMEFNNPYEYQEEHFRKTQILAEQKLGKPFAAFIAPCFSINHFTLDVVEQFKEIKVWFDANKKFSGLRILSVLNLEDRNGRWEPNSIHFSNFIKKYKPSYPLLSFTLHPPDWKDATWSEIEAIIDFLIEKGAVFMTASEYASYISNKNNTIHALS